MDMFCSPAGPSRTASLSTHQSAGSSIEACDLSMYALAQVSDLYDPREQWASYLINAIKAKELQKRDVNYIVKQVRVVPHQRAASSRLASSRQQSPCCARRQLAAAPCKSAALWVLPHACAIV
jgi:SecA preprotein cross-linking domain